MLSVKGPLLSSMRTRSSPGRASTAIFAISLRSKLKSAEPSSPTSTWRIAGLPACRRSAILSLASVPLTLSTPCLSFGCLNPDFLDECVGLSALMTGAAFPGPATTAATAPTTQTATITAEAASHDAGRTARDSLSRIRSFIGARLLSSEPRRGSWTWFVLAMVETADAHSHRGDPPVFPGGQALVLEAPLKRERATMIGGARPAPRPSLVAAQETRKPPCIDSECGSHTKR